MIFAVHWTAPAAGWKAALGSGTDVNVKMDAPNAPTPRHHR